MTQLFDVPFAPDDREIAGQLLANAKLSPAAESAIEDLAASLIEAIRTENAHSGVVETLLHKYAVSTKEGVALMMLAEAALRVDDSLTADLLIEDKIVQGGFGERAPPSDDAIEFVSRLLFRLANEIVTLGDNTEDVLTLVTKRLGMPAVRGAVRQAIKLIANHFVLGQTISKALQRARSSGRSAASYSFDMLGEAARTRADAENYFRAYSAAIQAVGSELGIGSTPFRPGISVKLSALHPRFDARQSARVRAELVPLILELAQMARNRDLQLTVDAEEADRLELSLEVIGEVIAHPSLRGWDGLGMAVQAYQKRAHAVIDWAASAANSFNRRLCIRLVKGAYWDTEIKRAQERGLEGFPVFTRKSLTDLNYMSCVEKLLGLRDRIYPQFATHNALTVASIIQRAGDNHHFEFQRLHGMGNSLYRALESRFPDIHCRTYAPVGGHRDLLAYLVRRLLENGANSSFVAVLSDRSVPVQLLIRHPAEVLQDETHAKHPKIRSPSEMFAPSRRNSQGIEFGHRPSIDRLLAEIKSNSGQADVGPICDGSLQDGAGRLALSPIDRTTVIGRVIDADRQVAERAVQAAKAGFTAWRQTPVDVRARTLDRAADIIESRRARLIYLLQAEGGKTIDDAFAEVREAVDFCRFYAAEARRLLGACVSLPGPVGERNELRRTGRGVFISISPWNFPLAIFIGQIAAALVAGNTVVAKPAEQTPTIAFEAVQILYEAGVPNSALQFVPGDGSVGEHLVGAHAVAGVAFTGSVDVARHINRQLAAKDGPIVPLIAETGGINAMIVDATALPEQVADDVIASCFRSAGQRCSALRVLYIQQEVADQIIEKIIGAARELVIGDPRFLETDIGPIIDTDAQQSLLAAIETLKTTATLLYEGNGVPQIGSFIAPHIFELLPGERVTSELFGPILQVVRYRQTDLDSVCNEIENTQFGLTLGLHSRIDTVVNRVLSRHLAGNVYVNRNMIGAVVGSQPFGGHGLSGTGPKAGGPRYLLRFTNEETTTVNTTAAGGNASLLGISE